MTGRDLIKYVFQNVECLGKKTFALLVFGLRFLLFLWGIAGWGVVFHLFRRLMMHRHAFQIMQRRAASRAGKFVLHIALQD